MIAVNGITNDVETVIAMLMTAIDTVSAVSDSRMNITVERNGGYDRAEMAMAAFSTLGVMSPA